MKIFVFLCLIVGTLNAEPEVRLGVVSGDKRYVLKGDLTVSLAGKELLKGSEIELKAADSGITVNGKASNASSLQVTSPKLIELDGRKFRKNLEVKQNSGKLSLVHALPMESYIVGVISSEVPTGWPLEVLKAQAITARTYAIWQKYKKEQLESSVLDQVYHGVHREHPMAERAVQETAGQILTFDSKPAHTYFHSCCGGHTASVAEVFGGEEPYLQGVKCPYCKSAPAYHWEHEFARSEIDKKLGAKVSKIDWVGESDSGRVLKVRFKSKPQIPEMKSNEFRAKMSYFTFKSTLITKKDMGWRKALFKGRGFGHGVGMCQWGAMNMAKQGKTAEEILSFYYPGTEISRFY